MQSDYEFQRRAMLATAYQHGNVLPGKSEIHECAIALACNARKCRRVLAFVDVATMQECAVDTTGPDQRIQTDEKNRQITCRAVLASDSGHRIYGTPHLTLQLFSGCSKVMCACPAFRRDVMH
jgi:hypothetical protein